MKTILTFCALLTGLLAFGQIKPVCFNSPVVTNSLYAGANANFVISADVNADGNMDLIASDYAAFTNYISVFLGSGTGTFAAAVNYTTGTGPKGLVARDLNADGYLDIAVCNAYSSNISVLLGSGTGTFGAATNYTVGTSPFALASADFNNDGQPDLVAGGYLAAGFSVLLSAGAGTFAAALSFTTQTSIDQVIAGDFNQDGKADIVMTDLTASVYFYAGSGAGGFAAPVVYTTPLGPWFITSADFDNDGFADLAFTDFAGVSILSGSSSGTFSLDTTLLETNGSNGITTADFNSDGNADLAISNGTTSVHVILGDGNGGFMAPLSFAVANAPYSLISADLNNDSKPDLAVACNSSVTTLINGTFNPSLNPVPTTTCAGYNVLLSASGGNTYAWSTGATSYSAAVNPTVPTGYTVTVSSVLGCNIDLKVNVNVIPGPTITVNSGTICEGQSFTLSPGGGLNYTFQGGSAVVSPSVTSSYTVAGSNSVGCVFYATSTVTVNPLPTVTASSGSICEGQSYFIVPGGNAMTFSFSGGSSIVSPTTTTSYSVTAISNLGCMSGTPAISTVSVIALPVISVNSGTVCSGQVFTIVATGAGTYTYEGGSDVVSPTVSTDYTVTGISTNGCMAALPALCGVSVAALPHISVNSGSLCAGQSFTIMPLGAGNYSFSGGSAVVSPTVNSSYIVTGTGTNGCVSDSSAVCNVAVYQLPPLTAGSSRTICPGEQVTLNVSGAPTITWSNGGSGVAVTVSPTVTTTYTVTGTNVVGCSTTIFVTQVVSACVGVEELSGEPLPQTRLYPNPTQGELTVELSQPSAVQIIDVFGQVLGSSNLEAGKNCLDLHGQPAGVYLIRVSQGSSTETLRIVKN